MRGITALLADDDTYACLPTVPGIGPRTASELVTSIDIGDFPDRDHLASYCGVVLRNRRSGTSISSVSASRQGNKRLKNSSSRATRSAAARAGSATTIAAAGNAGCAMGRL